MGKIRICILAAMAMIWLSAAAAGDPVEATADATAQAAAEAAPSSQHVGLVLSGGGAKGIAHIGVIQALEENDIPIDYITGTSMGAIVGGLYACGYTPQEMLDLILSKGFSYWSTGQVDPSLSYYFMAREQTPAMLTVPICSSRDSVQLARSAVPASLISPMPMSFAFMQLFSGYGAQCGGDFNRLFVPFRCVASDVAARHKVVLSHGDLGDAIRSSMSFPIVFQPTTFDGMLLYDGGIYDNFPVDVMNADFSPGFIIGVDVSTVAKGPQTSLMDQVENLVMQGSSYYLDPKEGVKIKFDLDEFGLLDFPQAREIYDIGYRKGLSMVDSIKGRTPSRRAASEVESRRLAFRHATPQVRFSDVDVTGGTAQQNRYIRYMFTDQDTDTFGIDKARMAYYRAVCTGKLRDLQPHALYDDTTGLFKLNLRASIKDDCMFGVGGYITSSTTSYVYLSGRYSTFSFKSLSANASAWLGQSYQGAMVQGRINMPTHIGTAIDLQAVAFRQEFFHDDISFFNFRDPSFVHKSELYGRLKWTMAAGHLSKLEVGVGVGIIRDSFYQPISVEDFNPYRDRCRFRLGQVMMKFEQNTLDDINYPVSGRQYRLTAMGVLGSYRQREGENGELTDKSSPRWLQLESVTRNYTSYSRHFSLGFETDVMLSTRKLLRDYNISIVAAPGYFPTPSSHNAFNPAFRNNSFVAASVVPVYRYNDNISARLSLSGFLPIRKICPGEGGRAIFKGPWLTDPEFFGELQLCYKLPFATVSAYCNYASSRSHDWNVGISFGIFMLAPEFLRQ